MKTLMGTSFVNELLDIIKQSKDADSVNIATEDILRYVQNLEDIAVRMAVYIAADRE